MHSLPKSQRIHNRRLKSCNRLATGVGKSASQARKWLEQHGYTVPSCQQSLEKSEKKLLKKELKRLRLEEILREKVRLRYQAEILQPRNYAERYNIPGY